jgi:hypothetical protein
MLKALHVPFARIVSAGMAAELAASETFQSDVTPHLGASLDNLHREARRLARAVQVMAGEEGETTPVDDFVSDLDSGVSWIIRLAREPAARVLPPLTLSLWLSMLAWLAVRGMGGPPYVPDRNRRCRQRMHAWHLDGLVTLAFREIGRDDAAASRASDFVAGIQELPMWSPDRSTTDASAVIASWLEDAGVRRALDVRRHQGVERFSTEAFQELVVWTTWVAAVRLAEYPQAYRRRSMPMIQWVSELSGDLVRAGIAAGERLDLLIE